MWWLTLPVIVYSAGLLVLWFILVRRGDGTRPGDECLPKAREVVAGQDAAVLPRVSVVVAAQDAAVLPRVSVVVAGQDAAVLPRVSVVVAAKDAAVLPRVSVVVAAHNEEKHLPALMESLSLQDYPPELLEIIIVNDNSTDRTPIVISEFISGCIDKSGPRTRLIYNPFSGKKRAVRYGIEKASGEVIITTDADCIVGPAWVRSHAEWYRFMHPLRDGKGEGSPSEVTHCYDHRQSTVAGSGCPDMVLATVVQKPARGFWSYFGVFEFSALQALTEATALAGRPVMCNAANMSFRRDVYMCHAGELRPDLPSGDDMFLLEAVMRDGGAVRHDGRRAAAAETAGAVTAAALLRQRARWASKAFHLRGASTLTLAAATAACNATVAAAAVAACVSVEYLPLAGAMYGIKAVPDYLLVAGEMKKRGGRMKALTFIVSEIIYPFYFMVVAVISLFPGSGRFRGR